jgi:hypothetical protein
LKNVTVPVGVPPPEVGVTVAVITTGPEEPKGTLEGASAKLVVEGLAVALATTMLQLAVVVLPCESTTWAVKLYVPVVVGAPVTAPVEVLSVKPEGSKPLMIANLYPGTPPVALSAEL